MARSLSGRMNNFIESVMRLEDLSVAAFDCDGTLWSGDAGEGFFWWEIEQGFVSSEVAEWARGRYEEYKAGNVPEEIMCGEMLTMHRGMAESEIQRSTDDFFERNLVQGIFPEMEQLVEQLHERGCAVWAVSSSSQWIIRSGMKHFGISPDRILATQVRVKDGVVSDELVRVPSGAGKPQAIFEAINRSPDAAFGNSQWDVEMLAMARYPFAINPNAKLKPIAASRGWTIYHPDSTGE